MENKLIEIQDLEPGDEILISCQSFFKYLKVLAKPTLSKTKVSWSTKTPLYSNVKCSTKQDIITKNYVGYSGKTYTRTEKKWILSPDDHNLRVSVDLNERQIWLIKKEY